MPIVVDNVLNVCCAVTAYVDDVSYPPLNVIASVSLSHQNGVLSATIATSLLLVATVDVQEVS